MDATKTTFFLPNALRAKLRVLAAREGVSVTALLTEGAELVIARHQGSIDREELDRRASAARERLRRGLYSGPPITSSVDEVVYASAGRRTSRRTGR